VRLLLPLAPALPAVLALTLLAPAALAADPVVFDNGTFITGVGTGTGGTDVSVAEPSPGVISVSFNAALASPARVVDDFIISNAPPGGQRLRRMNFYGVQTTTGGNTNVQFSAVFITLYDADPATGGNPIAGDFTTNRLTSTTFTGAYRLSSSGTFSNARPIQRLNIDMSWAPPLTSGTYWIAVSARGDFSLSASANPMAFFVTPRPAVNNAYQLFNGTYFSTFDYPFTLFGACRADFDNSGTRDVTDIFAFLSAWFASAPGSDFNGDTVRDVSDIFAFLSAWFAGCP